MKSRWVSDVTISTLNHPRVSRTSLMKRMTKEEVKSKSSNSNARGTLFFAISEARISKAVGFVWEINSWKSVLLTPIPPIARALVR
ncbi:MAG TPA: hypothetical protein VN739_04000 [Nitrososphaerales archaeon]|nr:hypothetical protein [Nitrososphaerales archaeon]